MRVLVEATLLDLAAQLAMIHPLRSSPPETGIWIDSGVIMPDEAADGNQMVSKECSGITGKRRRRTSTLKCKKARIAAGLSVYGAGTKSRTRDLLITSQLLYQLSYTGEKMGAIIAIARAE